MSSLYSSLDISEFQKDILEFITLWIKKEKTTIPLKEVVVRMETKGVKDYTTKNALAVLVRRGYLRRSSFSGGHKGTRYIQLRSV